MSVLIEDSPRNLAKWIVDARTAGTARGGVLTPFATPQNTVPGRRGAQEMADLLRDGGAAVWFDATTHALQMSGVGDFRWYDDYHLWTGPKGDLTTPAFRSEHVRLVFEIQDQLQAPHLAPTILLHHGESTQSQHALDLARAAIERDPTCWLSVAGTAPFWSSGAALDAHVGALAQLEPAGWFLTVARPVMTLPVEADSVEVEGLCRTTRALSEYAPVHISHGDLAGLPAVAAGADSVGSGWDQRQRVCAFSNYAARDPNGGGGGGWYERPTFRGLLGSLTVGDAALLGRRDPALARRLGPPPPPGPSEAFLHHMAVLNGVVNAVKAQGGYEARYRELTRLYAAAAPEWPAVQAITDSHVGAAEWIGAEAAGLARYGLSEGW